MVDGLLGPRRPCLVGVEDEVRGKGSLSCGALGCEEMIRRRRTRERMREGRWWRELECRRHTPVRAEWRDGV